jgi:hypothetical protein
MLQNENDQIQMKTEFTSDWKNWIQTNIDNGADKDQIFLSLLMKVSLSTLSVKKCNISRLLKLSLQRTGSTR